MRGAMERSIDAAFGEDTARRVTADLECRHIGDSCAEGNSLQVKHEVHVLLESIRNAHWRHRQFSFFAFRVVSFNALYSPLDLADIVQIFVKPSPICRAQIRLESI